MGYNSQNYNYRDAMNHGMPNHGMPNHVMSNHGMSNCGMPNHGMSNCGMPNHGMSNHVMSNHGMPNQEIPNQGMLNKESICDLFDERINYNQLNKKQLLCLIDKLCFYIQDLVLFLDTHPNDAMAIEMFNKYAVEKKKAMGFYEKLYGPLSIGELKDNDKWYWVKQSWPWEVEC